MNRTKDDTETDLHLIHLTTNRAIDALEQDDQPEYRKRVVILHTIAAALLHDVASP